MQFDPARFDVVRSSPAHMTGQERVVLYGMVVGLQPSLILEIGTYQGGSALIMCAALDDLGAGRLVCLDPNPQLSPETARAIEHRATVIAEASPSGVAAAREAAGGRFDLAFVDGDHSAAGVLADLEATLPALASGAAIVLHDAHYYEVEQGVGSFLERHRQVVDFGLVSKGVTATDQIVDGHPISWGGLRLLMVGSRNHPHRRHSWGRMGTGRSRPNHA